jgi:hypothetical protein
MHGPYGVMYYYCNIQECVTGKSVTVHGSYGVMYCHCDIQECVTGKLVTVHGPNRLIHLTIHYSIRSMDRY